ncbi:MAG: hypothetical protein D6677_08630, partial [Calditrichaeota bacterium]
MKEQTPVSQRGTGKQAVFAALENSTTHWVRPAEAPGRAAAGDRCAVYLTEKSLNAAGDAFSGADPTPFPLVVCVERRHPDLFTEFIRKTEKRFPIVFYPRDVQEAYDLVLVAQYVSEKAWQPVLCVLDGIMTAEAIQAWRPLPQKAITNWLGNPDDTIPDDDPATAQLLGKKH